MSQKNRDNALAGSLTQNHLSWEKWRLDASLRTELPPLDSCYAVIVPDFSDLHFSIMGTGRKERGEGGGAGRTYQVEAEDSKEKCPKEGEDAVELDEGCVEEGCQRGVYKHIQHHMQQPAQCEASAKHSND